MNTKYLKRLASSDQRVNESIALIYSYFCCQTHLFEQQRCIATVRVERRPGVQEVKAYIQPGVTANCIIEFLS